MEDKLVSKGAISGKFELNVRNKFYLLGRWDGETG